MYLHVSVTAGAKTDKLEQINSDHFRISVRARAEHNLANKRVLELMANFLRMPVNQIRIINGHHSPSKLLSVLD